MDIVKFDYTEPGIQISVPFDGNSFINATEIYKAFGKKPSTFSDFINGKLTDYANRLIALKKISVNGKTGNDDNEIFTDELIVTIIGGNSVMQGTWLHPKLALVFARWLSTDFEIWCDEKLDELLKTGSTSIAIPPVKQQLAIGKLSETYEKIRDFSNNSRLHILPNLVELVKYTALNRLSFSEELTKVSKLVNKETRVDLFTRAATALKRCVDDRNITSGMYIDMTADLERAHRRLLNRRITIESSIKEDALGKIELISCELKEKEQEVLKLKDTLESKTATEADNQELKRRLSVYTTIDVAPAFSIKLSKFNLRNDLLNAKAAVASTPGVKLVFCEYLAKNTVDNKRAPWKVYEDVNNSVGIYIDDNETSILLLLAKGRKDQYEKIVPGMRLTSITGGIFRGSYTVEGVTYYAFCEPNSGGTFIYSIKYKQ